MNRYNILYRFCPLVLIFFLYYCSGTGSQRSYPRYPAQTAQTVPEYRLGFGDVVEVKFFNNDRFNETVRVRPDGRISLERVGDIFVAGMTPSQLDNLITQTYAEIIQNPDVTIFVREFGGYQVYVLGEVNNAGGHVIQRNMTLLQAIAAAGGAKNSASLGSVMLLRSEDGENVQAYSIDVDEWLDGETANLPLALRYVRPRDIIYVPRTFIASASTFLKQVWDGLIPPVNVYLQALLWSRWTE
jgi:polysaccharide export outer membrane protein